MTRVATSTDEQVFLNIAPSPDDLVVWKHGRTGCLQRPDGGVTVDHLVRRRRPRPRPEAPGLD